MGVIRTDAEVRDLGKNLRTQGQTLPQNVYDFVALTVYEIVKVTPKALNLYIKMQGLPSRVEVWFPKSVLVADRNNFLWCKRWFMEQKEEEIKQQKT